MVKLPASIDGFRRFGLPVVAALIAFFLAACDDASDRALRHYDRGLSLVENGAPEKAALEFRNALRMDESFVAARFELATLLEHAGDLTGAVANLHAVVETDPAHSKARVRLASAMLMADAPRKAMEHAEVAVRTAPQSPEALLARSLAAYRLGDVRLALNGIEQVLTIEPGNADAGLLLAMERYDSGDADAAHAFLDEYIAFNPGSVSLPLTKLRYLAAANDQVAIGKHLTRTLAHFPERTDLRQMMVDWHMRNGDLVAAERELQNLQKLLPDDPATVWARVSVMARMEGDAAARQLLLTEISRASDPEPLKLQLARFNVQTGSEKAATGLLKDLIEKTNTAGTRAEARLLLARIRGSQQNFSAANEVLSDLLEDDPGHAEAMAMRAAAHLRRDAIGDALVDIKNALFEEPENPRYLSLAGKIYQRNGSPILAGDSLASAVRDSNFAAEPVLAYGNFLLNRGDKRAHQTLLEEAWRRNPEAPEVGNPLARLYIENRNWTAAAQMIPALSAMDPIAAKQIEAELAFGRQEYATAIRLLDRLGGENTKGDGVLTAMVQAHLGIGEPEAARQIIDAELLANPKNFQALYLDAALHEVVRSTDDAERSYRKLVRIAPQIGFSYLVLASFLDRSERVAEAKETLAIGLQHDPQNTMLRLHMASLELRLGNPQAAIAEFEEIYARQPDSLLAANNLASALAEYASSDPEQLARAEKIARRLAGSANPAFRDTYGWTLVLTGNAKDALGDLQSSADALPDNPWVRYHTGIAYLEVGQPTQARVHLNAALQLSENQPFLPRGKIRQVFADLED